MTNWPTKKWLSFACFAIIVQTHTHTNPSQPAAKPSTVHTLEKKPVECILRRNERILCMECGSSDCRAGRQNFIDTHQSAWRQDSFKFMCTPSQQQKKHKQSMLKILWTKNEFINRMQQKKERTLWWWWRWLSDDSFGVIFKNTENATKRIRAKWEIY